MNASTRQTTRRRASAATRPRRLAAVLAGLLLAGGGERAFAAGSICRQDCGKGRCAQVLCQNAGPAGGYARCAGGSQPWAGGPVYSSWCVAWGRSYAAAAAPVAEAGGHGVSQPAVAITQPEVMAAALRAANPWVATLVGALQDGTRWLDGPAQGLLHDSYVDEVTAALSHTAAQPFTARVTSNGLGAAQIDILVTGDVARLSRLQHYVDGAAPAAILPRQIHGAVTAGGLHGLLHATGADGRTQVIEW
jgi:hypothetical protein